MTLQITSGRAATLAAAGTENYPIIAWDNRGATGTLSSSGTVPSSNPATNAFTGSTYDTWESAPVNDSVVLGTTLAASETINFMALAAHNLADVGAGVVAQTTGATRTNLHLRSQDFSTGWAVNNGTYSALTDAALQSPYGGTTAGSFLCSTTDDVTRAVRASANITVSATTAYTASIFVKALNWTWIGVALAEGSALSAFAAAGRVNLSTGATTLQAGTAITATDYGNGWWRISITGTTSAATGYRLNVTLLDADEGVGQTAVGVVGAGVYIWGAQLESGTTLTSYIPTVSAAVPENYHDIGLPIIPEADDPLAWYFADTSGAAFRFRFYSTAGAPGAVGVGVAFIGAVMTMDRPFYQGYAPIIRPTEVELQSNVSAGGHLLGSAVVKRGSRLQMDFANLSDSFVRGDDFAGFMEHFNEGGAAFVAWRPTKYPDDLHYFWRDGATIRPTNSGPKALMGLTIEGRVYEG